MTTRPPSPIKAGPVVARAFTLIEIMIVIAIVALIITAGIPMMWRAMVKQPLAKAVNDTIEGCKLARDRAILRNRPYDFVIRNRSETETEFTVEEAKIRDPSGLAYPGSDKVATSHDSETLVGGFPRALGKDVAIRTLDVNFIDHMGASEAHVRFYQNGTSDDFTVTFEEGANRRVVTVDIITGMAYELLPK